MIVTPMLCLSLAIYKESRGTTFKDQVLVARSVITRAIDAETNNYCKIIFKKGQYSWTANLKYRNKFKNVDHFYKYYDIREQSAMLTAVIAADNAYTFNNQEIRHFYSPHKGVKPYWSKHKIVVHKDKNFIFYLN